MDFKFMEDGDGGKHFKVKCLKCNEVRTKYDRKGNIELLSITSNSVYNARQHMQLKHKECLEDFETLWKEKEKPSESLDDNNNSSKSSKLSHGSYLKQGSLDNHLVDYSSSNFKQIRCQDDLDKAILNHIIKDRHPFSEVDKEGFKELLGGLVGKLAIRSRAFFVKLLAKQYMETKKNLLSEFQRIKHVSSTADCWTAHRRSFLGMTTHWIGEDLVRRSAFLGVRRIYGKHTYDVIAKPISNIHKDFQIQSKVNCTITDNGSNFVKAFKIFTPPVPQVQVQQEEIDDQILSDEEDIDDKEFVFIDIGEIFQQHNDSLEARSHTSDNGNTKPDLSFW